jgi:hypothetical protein
MPLPTLEAPRYEAKIPSSGKKISFRTYLVKEEKLLLLAMESEDQNQILGVMKDVVASCTFNKVDVESLTLFDIEYLFLKLRSKSVGEVATVGIKCEKCESSNKVSINLDQVGVSAPAATNKIKLTDKIGVVMRYPKVSQLKPNVDDKAKIEVAISIVIDCIESIYDEKGIYPADESSRDELRDFVDSLNKDQFVKMQEFVAGMPKLEHECKFKCGKCGVDNVIKISGLQSFFE